MIYLSHLFVFNCLLTYVKLTTLRTPQTNVCEFASLIDGQEISFMKHNFTNLFNPNEDIILQKGQNEIIMLQLCSMLHSSCNGQGGYSICLRRNKEEIGIGKMFPKLINNDGKIIYNFTGDDCTKDKKYTVIIIMKCDYLATNRTRPKIFPQEMDNCTFYMIWNTDLACTNRMQQTCKIISGKSHYDLSPLTQYSDNYVINTSSTSSAQIIFNVCHSIIFEHNTVCLNHPPAGACLKTSDKDYTPLGIVESEPFIKNGNLTLVYENGDMCTAVSQNANMKFTITFICDQNAVDSLPTYVSGLNTCDYQLTWRTKAGCTVESQRAYRAAGAIFCTVTNSITSFVYDMKPLSEKDFTVTSLNGTQFTLRVCKSQENRACQQGTGVCSPKNNTSYGLPNGDLLWNHNGPYLNYTNGDECGNGQHRYTVIRFLCGAENSTDGPVIVEEEPCHVTVHWVTELACEERVKCFTEKNEINLTPLIRNNENYVVKSSDMKFYINVCRSILPKTGVVCPPGVAVCAIPLDLKDKNSIGINLGLSAKRPVIVNENSSILSYVDGSPCKEIPSRRIQTNITFLCDTEDKEAPVYKEYKDCTYLFEWRTSLACRGLIGSWSPPCNVKDEHSHDFDLSLLPKVDTLQGKNKGGKQYNVALCGKNTCDSAICADGKKFGALSQVVVDHDHGTIRLQYLNGSACNESSYMSEIRLICNSTANDNNPELLWENDCSVGIAWRTGSACANKPKVVVEHGVTSVKPVAGRVVTEKPMDTTKQPEVAPKTVVEESSALPGVIGGISMVVLVVLMALAVLMYWRKRRSSNCSCPGVNLFGFRRSNSRVHYCRVNTTEEARLLLNITDPTECQSDSDEDLLDA